ncbi:MAG: branched-chain amino acid ABC transporter permease [Alphaproteobacteria bacterium]|nr:branched-chain amino acid ABC transporter permease [Alphaproteobacteria bacterium]
MWVRFCERWFGLLLILGLACLPFFLDKYTQFVVNLILVYVTVGIGLNFLLGYTGQFAFAHAALMGIGAYTVGLLTTRLGISFWIALPLAGVAAAAIGGIGALPALRMKRAYLALVTLAFAELIQWVLIRWKDVTLGTDGVSIRPPRFFDYALKGDYKIFWLILVVTVIMYVIARRLTESRIGRSWVAVRENEIVAQCNGINVTATKLVVFMVSAFYAGIGGGLFAATLGYIVPDGFGLLQLVLHFSIVVIGGMGSVFGGVIGSLLLTTLPELLREYPQALELIYGILLCIFIIFMPTGIAGFLKQWRVLPPEVMSRNWQALRDRPRPEKRS